ncbi:MAG: hypothetical protein NC350_04155, partial [Corallococcus sp.]|nr:hypothetical protein [Corallococcus sp.]
MQSRNKTFIVLIIFCLVCICVFLSGCEDKFIPVVQVEFTSGGVTQTKNSTKRAVYQYLYPVTADDYWSVPYEEHITDQSGRKNNLETSYKIPQEQQGKTKYLIKTTESTKRYYQGYSFTDAPLYSAYSYEGMEYLIVYVKVINHTTIVIKDNDGETTYTVSSYKI